MEEQRSVIEGNSRGFGMANIGKMIKNFWMTKDTITNNEEDIKIKTTIRELVVYIIFLAVLCIIAFGMMNSSTFYYNQAVYNLFLDAEVKDNGPTFTAMSSIEDLWNFIKNPLLTNLYPEQWYNELNLTDEEIGFVIHENKLLGVPRLRQLRVRNNSCIIPDTFQELIKECYDTYSSNNEFKHSFGTNDTAWTYHDESYLKSSSYTGQLTTYGGGGFSQDLGLSRDESSQLVGNLFDNLWIDRGTRAVIIEFTLYNANINLFCIVRLAGRTPSHRRSVSIMEYSNCQASQICHVYGLFYFGLRNLFVIFLVYYTIEEVLEIKLHKCSYFKNIWNILDVVNLLIGFSCCIFDIYRTVTVGKTLDKLLQNPTHFPNFVFLGYCQDMANSALAIMVFFSWIKIFKYISFNKTMTQLSSTLSRCSKDLGGFAVMFFIFFLAFAQLGYLLFGSQNPDYNSIGTCIFTLFRFILGDFDFAALEQANRVLGPIYFVSYVFFVFFILLNMFLAIINDTYSEVKSDLAEAKNEFEMGEYFKKGAMKMLDKFSIKKEKLMDIQTAMKMGDMNNDGVVDFEEWRYNMKKKGYADVEIEAVFSKYDTDGNRNLDGKEQENMESDLERQKTQLDEEINKSSNQYNDSEFQFLQNKVKILEDVLTKTKLEVTEMAKIIASLTYHGNF